MAEVTLKYCPKIKLACLGPKCQWWAVATTTAGTQYQNCAVVIGAVKNDIGLVKEFPDTPLERYDTKEAVIK